jgi:hypothetical protein
MAITDQYSNIDISDLELLYENEKDIHTKLSLLIAIKSRSENSAIVKSIEIAMQLKLPYTDESHSPLPNLFLRSNLFSASKTHGQPDVSIKDYQINCYQPDKEELHLTAYRQFNQLDLDLLLALIPFQQKYKSHLLKVTPYEIIKKVKGKGEGKQTYLLLKEQLKLFQNASLTLKFNRYNFVGSILNNAYFDDDEQLYIIEFNPKFQPLFSGSNWTSVDLEIRRDLNSNLAKWLHGFYSSHTNSNIPINFETIYNLSGSTAKDFSNWVRKTLLPALKKLQLAFTKHGGKFNFKINNEKLIVNKTQSKSQNKNIKNKVMLKTRTEKVK